MSLITIVTVNWYGVELIEAMLDNLYSRAAWPDLLKTIVIDNTNGVDSSLEKLHHSMWFPEIYNIDSKGLTSSKGHAFALNYAMSLLDTDYVLIVDPDIYVFKEKWDSFCVNEIERNDSLAIGAPYPFWKIGKYHNFPSPPFSFLRTKYLRQMDADWTPFSRTKIGNTYMFLIRQFCRLAGLMTRKSLIKNQNLRKLGLKMENIFGVFSQDTGWRIARKARAKKHKSVLFKAVLPCEMELCCEKNITAFQELAGQYELYYYNDKPMLTHMYSTAVKSWRTSHSGDSDYWRECIELFQNSIANSENK